MPTTPTYPGDYAEETPSGKKGLRPNVPALESLPERSGNLEDYRNPDPGEEPVRVVPKEVQ